MYREPLDEFLLPINMRLPHAHPHPDAMKLSVRHNLEAIRPSMARMFSDVQEQYQRGVKALAAERAFLGEVEANNMSWEGLDKERYSAASSTKQKAMLDCEILSEALLLGFDMVVTFVVTELTGKEKCPDLGEVTAHGVRLDRLLDAFGNYIRHRYEWRRQRYLNEPFERNQSYSIEALALALTGKVLTGPDAVQAVMDTPMPATATLDIVADFEHNGFRVSYDLLEDRILRLCSTIIDVRFLEWFEEFRARESQRNATSAP